MTRLIGAMLMQLSCTEQFAASLALAVLSNSVTQKTVEALSYALLEMATLTTNMCDQLRALTITLSRLRTTSPSDLYVIMQTEAAEDIVEVIVEDFDL